MKIRPVILCGGEGNRLWPNTSNAQPKQFINFGNWSLLEKTLKRIKSPIFDFPIISTNIKYLNEIRRYLKKFRVKKYKIILEPAKRNTAPAILTATLIKDIQKDQPIIFFPADHLIENKTLLNGIINENKSKLTDQNIFIFGIKPNFPSSEYGYFLTKKIKGNIDKVTKFIEKPNLKKAKKIISKKGAWNSGMFYFRKDSIINNFKRHQPDIYKHCLKSIKDSKIVGNIYYLNKSAFLKIKSKSFDYAILEKSKNINAIKIDIPWSDLGNWKEIAKIYEKSKKKYFRKKNVFYRPWGNYVNLFKGKNFLVKELTINPKSSISLQKHFYRSEYWNINKGKPKITVNKKTFFKKKGESVFIPVGAIHRIENLYKEPVKIIEIQTGKLLKESDILRYKDVYGRIN